MSLTLARSVGWPDPGGRARRTAPGRAYRLAGRMLPWCWGTAALAAGAGLVVALGVASADAGQGDAFRIAYVHLPASWVSLLIYVALVSWAALGLALGARLPMLMASALAPTGVLMSFLALWSGALWVRPTAGSWWVWDARLSSLLLLLVLYVGVVALQAASDEPGRGERASALLSIVGMVHLPIVYVALRWWGAPHPGALLDLERAPTLDAAVLWGLLLMTAAFWAWSLATALHRLRSLVLEREAGAAWVHELPELRA